jgi:hypothetical protein
MAYDMLASIAPINPQAFGPVVQQGQPPQGGMPQQGGDVMTEYLMNKVAEIRGDRGQGALGGVMASMAQPQRVPPQ